MRNIHLGGSPMLLAVGGVRGKGITSITCPELRHRKPRNPPFFGLWLRHYLT
jgi:hypothetical protein